MQVYCRWTFEALHYWPDAPDHVAYLRHPHRHVFHGIAYATVSHTNREIEIITMKKTLENFCKSQYGGEPRTNSCEDIALELIGRFPFLTNVTISEDGENGASVTRVPRPQSSDANEPEKSQAIPKRRERVTH